MITTMIHKHVHEASQLDASDVTSHCVTVVSGSQVDFLNAVITKLEH